MDERAFDYARPAAVRAITHGAGQLAERQVALIRRTGKPLRGHPTDAFAATHIHPVTAAGIAAGIKNLHIHGSNLHEGRRKTFLRPSTRHGQRRPTLTLLHTVAIAAAHEVPLPPLLPSGMAARRVKTPAFAWLKPGFHRQPTARSRRETALSSRNRRY